MDKKAFEKKVLGIMNKLDKVKEHKTYHPCYFQKEDIASEITSLIEPLLELVKVQEEMIKYKGIFPTNRELQLLQRISELKKQIEK